MKTRHCPLSPWFNAECRALRRRARRLERIYRRTQLPKDRLAWIHFVRHMRTFYRDREQEYWETIISSQSSQPKKLWTTFNGLLGRSASQRSQNPPPFTADEFLEKLSSKITSIRESTSAASPPDYAPTDCRFSTLREVTSAELRSLIVASAPKTCELDPVPTFIVQEFNDDLLPFLTALCNRSIQEAHLPASQKQSILHPVLKRDGLDSSDPANYRRVRYSMLIIGGRMYGYGATCKF